MFTLTRVYSDAVGESHFEDVIVPLVEAGNISFDSKATLMPSIQNLFGVKAQVKDIV